MIEVFLNKLKEEQKQRFSISQMGFCPLQNFFLKEKGLVKKIDENVLAQFEVGKSLHDKVITSILEKFPNRFVSADYDDNLKLQYEFSDKNIPPLTGSFDLYDKIEKEVIDLKFFEHFAFVKINEIHRHYIAQLTLYMYLLENKGFDVKRGKIIYISKKTFQEKIFTLEKDNIYAEDLIEDYKSIMTKNIERLKSKSPREKWECKYCQFNKECENAIIDNKNITKDINIDTKRLADLLSQKKEIEEEIEEMKQTLPEVINYEDENIRIKTIESVRKKINEEELNKFLLQNNKMLSDFQILEKNVYKKIEIK